MRSKLLLVTLVAALAVLMGARTAKADGVVSDSLTVYDATGAIVASVSADEANENTATLYYINNSTLADPSMLGSPTVLCEEGVVYSGEQAVGCVNNNASDIFGVEDAASYYLVFASDTDLLSSPYHYGAFYFYEGNGTFDATQYLAPNLQTAGYTAIFQSDPVPEPGTLMLFGTGLLFMAGFIRRKIK